ncbi:MAG: hypothetical protein ACRCUP_04450 [Mycoplasmatales bacterium]
MGSEQVLHLYEIRKMMTYLRLNNSGRKWSSKIIMVYDLITESELFLSDKTEGGQKLKKTNKLIC